MTGHPAAAEAHRRDLQPNDPFSICPTRYFRPMRGSWAVAALAVAAALCVQAAAAAEPREYPLGAVPKAVSAGHALCKAQAVDRCSGEATDAAECVKCLLDRCMVRAESDVRCQRPERTETEAAGTVGSGSQSAQEILASAATGTDFLRGVRRREEERTAQQQVQRQLEVAPWEWEVRPPSQLHTPSPPSLSLTALGRRWTWRTRGTRSRTRGWSTSTGIASTPTTARSWGPDERSRTAPRPKGPACNPLHAAPPPVAALMRAHHGTRRPPVDTTVWPARRPQGIELSHRALARRRRGRRGP